MKLILASVISAITLYCSCEQTSTINPEVEDEDRRILKETVAKYGLFYNYTDLDLPGPELLTDDDKFSMDNIIATNSTGNYTLRLRTITEYFSYNGRYEVGGIKNIDDLKVSVVKGQFGEHFERKIGGYYIRTVGYQLDEQGYRLFLIDLSVAATTEEEETLSEEEEEGEIVPLGGKVTISTTLLITLNGGNLG